MLNEAEKRKPNFDERNSAPVVLADGQTWHVPKPWLEIRPVFRRGKAVSAYPVLTCGAELDGLVEAMSECEDLDSQVVAVASLAAHLLCWHYELTDAELDGLLCFRAADAASVNWLREIFGIATGRSGPKAYSAGGD
jgi:hypothetical protein